MKSDELTYRFLTEDDLPKYVEFCSKLTSMRQEPVDNGFYARLPKKLDHRHNKKHVAAFNDQGEIVSAMTGVFSESIPFWFLTLHVIKTKNNSLSNHIDFINIFNNTIKLLTDYAEQIGYYNFYIRRTLPHQRAHEKLLNIALRRGLISDIRYDYLYEKIYSPEDSIASKCSSTVHKIFFTEDIPSNPSVMVLYILKQQFRKELLLTKHSEYQAALKTS